MQQDIDKNTISIRSRQALSFFFLFFFSITSIFSNDSISKMIKENEIISRSKETLTLKLLEVGKNDTLNIKIISDVEKEEKWKERNMPWIGALFLGILAAGVTIVQGKRSRKDNKENMDRQMETAERNLKSQIESSERSLKLQMESAQKIAMEGLKNSSQTAQLDFNKTVLSGNRQAWINDLRELISKIIAKIVRVSVKVDMNHLEFEELKGMIIKAEFMLNAEKDAAFIKALQDLEACCLAILLKQKKFSDLSPFIEEVKKHTITTLKTEWERVKKGE
jgi:hypothetical protein